MAARLPIVGGDNGNWGQILNDFLTQAHNEDGSFKSVSLDQSTSTIVNDGSSTTSAALQAHYTPREGDLTAGAVGSIPRSILSKLADSVSVKDFGAKGDGVNTGGGSITASSAVLTASGGKFTASAVGKVIAIYGAGASGVPLLTTISAYVSSTQVVLSTTATTTVTNADVWYGTDDTDAIQEAMNSGRNILVPAGIYIVGSRTTGTGLALMSPNDGHNITGAGRRISTIKLMPNPAHTSLGMMVFYGGTISGLKLDGGYVPAFGDSDLSSLIVIGVRATIRDCHVLNAQGSLVFANSGCVVDANRLEKFGDHATYCATNPVAGGSGILDVYITNNQITEDVTYHNSQSGGTNHGSIKVRDNVGRVVIDGNTLNSVVGIVISASNTVIEGIPSQVIISNNAIAATLIGIHLTTADPDPAIPADAGFRLTDVIISTNNIKCSPTAAGITLNQSAALIECNVFTGSESSTCITRWGSLVDYPPSTIKGNKFYGANIGIYNIGSRSLIEGNAFYSIVLNAINVGYACTVIANQFYACYTGIYIASSFVTDVYGVYSFNVMTNGTYPVRISAGARNYSFEHNTMIANSQGPSVGDALSFNGSETRGNYVTIGGALPSIDTSSNPIIWGGRIAFTLGSLPTAAGINRGKMIVVRGGTGVADSLYICIRDAAGNYLWKTVTLT
jgi:hypothetical protein